MKNALRFLRGMPTFSKVVFILFAGMGAGGTAEIIMRMLRS